MDTSAPAASATDATVKACAHRSGASTPAVTFTTSLCGMRRRYGQYPAAMRRVVALFLLGALATPTWAAAPTPTPSALPPAQGVNVQPDAKDPHRSKSGTFLELGTITPGVAIADALVLRSTFDVPAQVDLYPADAQPAVGGGFGFSAKNEPRKQVGAWLKLSTSR